MELYSLIQETHKNSDHILLLIERFDPLLKKYSRLLNDEDAYSDLIVFFIALIRRFPESIKNDGKIVNYIKISIRNEYIRLSIKRRRLQKSKITLKDEPEYNEFDIDVLIDLYNALDRLTERQKYIVIENILNNKTTSLLGKELNLSRTTISKEKRKGLEQLKKILS